MSDAIAIVQTLLLGGVFTQLTRMLPSWQLLVPLAISISDDLRIVKQRLGVDVPHVAPAPAPAEPAMPAAAEAAGTGARELAAANTAR